MSQYDIDEPEERRIAKRAAFVHQVGIKRCIVARHYLSNERQVGVLGLQNHTPALAFTASSPTDLRQHRKRMFISTEVGIIQQRVGIQYSDHTNTVEVKPFAYHLRTDEHISAPRREVADESCIGISRACCVEIHPGHACFGQQLTYLVFHFLGSVATPSQFGAAAVGTNRRHMIRKPAVMARELIHILMQCESHITIRAVRNPSAYTTFDHRREAATVLEENHLLFPGQRLAHSRQQLGRKRACHHLAPGQVFDVNHLDFRHCHIAKSRVERNQSILTLPSIFISFGRRCGCSEQCFGAIELRQNDSCRASMVSRSGLLLLKRGLVFFIHDDES